MLESSARRSLYVFLRLYWKFKFLNACFIFSDDQLISIDNTLLNIFSGNVSDFPYPFQGSLYLVLLVLLVIRTHAWLLYISEWRWSSYYYPHRKHTPNSIYSVWIINSASHSLNLIKRIFNKKQENVALILLCSWRVVEVQVSMSKFVYVFIDFQIWFTYTRLNLSTTSYTFLKQQSEMKLDFILRGISKMKSKQDEFSSIKSGQTMTVMRPVRWLSYYFCFLLWLL